jgi:hypothetical protein
MARISPLLTCGPVHKISYLHRSIVALYCIVVALMQRQAKNEKLKTKSVGR